VRAVLDSLPRLTRPGTILDLPFQWPQPGWEREVERAYQEEAHVLVAQRRRTNYDAAGNFIAQAAADEAATYCADCAV
jgi:YD repeat-containing protein